MICLLHLSEGINYNLLGVALNVLNMKSYID